MAPSRILLLAVASLSFVLVGVAPTHAQSMFLERGTSGFALSGAVSLSDDWTGFIGHGGYSVSGLVDVGLSVGKFSADLSDLSFWAISPSASACVLKQSPAVPLSVEIAAGYERDFFSSDALDYLGWEARGTAFSFGVSAYGAIEASPTLDLYPMFGVGITHGEAEIEDSYGRSVSSDDNATGFGFGISMAFQLPEKNVFYITPSIAFGEDITTFRLSFGGIVLSAPTEETVPPSERPSPPRPRRVRTAKSCLGTITG